MLPDDLLQLFHYISVCQVYHNAMWVFFVFVVKNKYHYQNVCVEASAIRL